MQTREGDDEKSEKKETNDEDIDEDNEDSDEDGNEIRFECVNDDFPNQDDDNDDDGEELDLETDDEDEDDDEDEILDFENDSSVVSMSTNGCKEYNSDQDATILKTEKICDISPPHKFFCMARKSTSPHKVLF